MCEKLPLPRLEDALQSYEEACKPLLDEKEREVNTRICAKFASSDALLLDAKLRHYYEGLTGFKNWMQDFWKKEYLQNRQSLLLSSNYALLLKKQDIKKDFEARFVLAAALVYKQLFIKPLKELKIGSYSYDTTLLSELFACSRLPGKDCDTWLKNKEFTRHICVFYKQNVYKVELFNEEKELISLEDLSEILQKIRKGKALQTESFFASSLLGSAHCATFLQDFLKANASAFACFNESIFHVSLQDGDLNECLLNTCLLGKGLSFWPYKPFSFFLTHTRAGVNMEHTGADGAYVVYILEELLKLLESDFKSSFKGSCELLEFNYTKKECELLKDFRHDYKTFASLYEYERLSFEYDFAPFLNTSQDAIAQLILQFCQSTPSSIYSACAMNHYYEGRTEALYTLSEEGLDFVKALRQGEFKQELFKAAINHHKSIIKRAKKGEGFARYLSGLNWMLGSEEVGYFYDSRGYKLLTQNFYSTSTLGPVDGVVQNFLFVPPKPSRLGIGYFSSKGRVEFDIVYHKDDKALFLDFKKALASLAGILKHF